MGKYLHFATGRRDPRDVDPGRTPKGGAGVARPEGFLSQVVDESRHRTSPSATAEKSGGVPFFQDVHQLLRRPDYACRALHLWWNAGLQSVRLRGFKWTASCAAEKSPGPAENRSPGARLHCDRFDDEPAAGRLGKSIPLGRPSAHALLRA